MDNSKNKIHQQVSFNIDHDTNFNFTDHVDLCYLSSFFWLLNDFSENCVQSFGFIIYILGIYNIYIYKVSKFRLHFTSVKKR